MRHKVNEIKISYCRDQRVSKLPKANNSAVAAALLFDSWDTHTIALFESFKVLLLNANNKVKGIYELSTGGITGTVVDIRLLFAVVLKSLSVGIILVHNHPSGNLKPSEQDKRLTEKIKRAADLLDIKVLDHLIINADGDYYSFSDEGLL